MIVTSARRIERLRSMLDGLSIDAALISRNANRRYFSGFQLGDAEGSGWSGTLLVTRDATVIFADSRYTEQAERQAPDWELVATVGPIQAELPKRLASDGITSLGLEARVMPHADWSALAEAAPGVELHAIDDELVPLRLHKEPDEIEAIARACALTDACFTHLVDFIRPGMTEQQVALELERFFRTHGAEGLAFEPIVLAGARAAMPHGRPSDATIERGNVLLIDFGCAVDGYRSDMTRTLFVGEVPEQIRAHHDSVREAQAAALDAITPGVDGQHLDALARDRIVRDGVASYGHGLGHGIGLETHEAPSLRKAVSQVLEPGMVFSVEPGIYLPGVTGIRIEDIVALEPAGPRLLTTSPRDAVTIG